MALIFKWNIDKIYIYPLGGITKFNESINRPLKEELLIVLMGPIFQIIFFNYLKRFNITHLDTFHHFLLLFNLLPIYPLDGGKIFNILLSFFFPYRFSLLLTFITSFIFYSLGFIFYYLKFSPFFFLAFLSLSFKVLDEYRKRRYYYNKFLLERNLKNFSFRKIKYINSYKNMYRDCYHYFYSKDKVISESTFLKDYFK